MPWFQDRLVWFVWRLADVPAPELGNLTATAILGWYAWHTASRTLPHLVAEFRAEMAAARDDCRQERHDLHDALTQEREQRQREQEALVDALRGLRPRAGDG